MAVCPAPPCVLLGGKSRSRKERDLAEVSGLGREAAEQDERKRERQAVGSGEVHGTCRHSLSPSTGQCAVSLGTGPEWEDTEMARAPSRRTLMPLPPSKLS